eukprot:CAMPEP_0181174034 /NCGR_PEP_ID=MMETSP1096-20121128/3318_1 /TAXON_ID=156174 ORGANISM="Chrysochromulina ericina, Strain CCMP281" /NCGR_SAMPLE_ID=MMETSP1096 /ASSEMBLY_ACC=CAM_ASM_000453 /LENGTH=61 /DNA_ID=CAMNT_0023261903 /DNA_START=690 /DNA_END=875 /DNA_ORIENTATION=+
MAGKTRLIAIRRAAAAAAVPAPASLQGRTRHSFRIGQVLKETKGPATNPAQSYNKQANLSE